ncbi:MAG: aminotransferase class V-fold PLP-dependent enzyme, partial [Acidimicrobiales bacterium]|nr:aminotransferase class V-fold PLP-dependent enzyme [Acidimicrobiales bacterium]
MHQWTETSQAQFGLALSIFEDLISTPKDPKWGADYVDDLVASIDGSVGSTGRGDREALALFRDVVLPACRPNDCPMMLSYVPTAPSVSAKISDALVGVASIFAGHWEGGAGAIAAENEALRWLAGVAHYPESAGGVFVAGGSAANLSALAVARKMARERGTHGRLAVITGEAAHTSVVGAAELLDMVVFTAPGDDKGRLTGAGVRDAAGRADAEGCLIVAVVATGGATLTGMVDKLDEIADFCEETGAWMHVDAAYGGAGLLLPELSPIFAGFERSDSFGIDPHKWLFTPYDCAALVYRDPSTARRTFPQRASYLQEVDRHDQNPSDLAFHLSRRARGLPLWFSLVANGTEAYEAAVRRTIEVS